MSDFHDPEPPRSPLVLSARERSHLKARAHTLEPVVRIGHAGLTDASVAEIDRALTSHELIKVKIGEGDRDERAQVTAAIGGRTGAALVQQVGRVLVLWRPRPDDAEASPSRQNRDVTASGRPRHDDNA